VSRSYKKLKQSGDRILQPVVDPKSGKAVEAEPTRRGRYGDGANLFFCIGKYGERRWTFIYRDRVTGRPHELGLGGAPHGDKPAVSLAEARRKADVARRLLADGKDPLTERTAKRRAAVAVVKAEVAAATTFGEYADRFVAQKVKEFDNPVHRRQWESTLTKYAASLRPMAVQDVDTTAVLKALRPIWDTIPETAGRVRARIEMVLAAATVEGLRTGDNPARWVGHLKAVLPSRKGSDVKNHAALPYSEAPAFMTELRKLTSVSARALEFAILNTSRTGEVRGATWSEIDLENRVWVVPAERMKARKEHRVPLNDRAIEILKGLRVFSETGPTDSVFQSAASGRMLSNMAMAQCLKGIREGITVHGFRSTFRDWAGDETKHEKETIEFCLAHVVGDASEAAYRRSSAFDKRRALLLDWETYLR
jgi:integrase